MNKEVASEGGGAATVSARRGPLTRLLDGQKRQVRQFVADVSSIRGLMPLMMKNRNGGTWTLAEKAELLAQLRTLSRVSPYLLFLLVPGSALLLPVCAWWLDRRRKPRNAAQP